MVSPLVFNFSDLALYGNSLSNHSNLELFLAACTQLYRKKNQISSFEVWSSKIMQNQQILALYLQRLTCFWKSIWCFILIQLSCKEQFSIFDLLKIALKLLPIHKDNRSVIEENFVYDHFINKMIFDLQPLWWRWGFLVLHWCHNFLKIFSLWFKVFQILNTVTLRYLFTELILQITVHMGDM